MLALARRAFLAIQGSMLGFEPGLADDVELDDAVVPAPLFLVGAPRTGSTLFAQALLGRYRLAYISNVMAVAPRYMTRLVRVVSRAAGPFQGSPKDSQWGYVPGTLAPNEAGRIMGHWFGPGKGSSHHRLVARTVKQICQRLGAPMFFKNQANTLRLSEVLAIFPDARFVLLRRDPLFTAQSILLAREALLGSRGAWWSVRPPGCKHAIGDPCGEVLCQIRELERLGGALARLGESRFAEVWYEDFCAAPAATLDLLGQRFGLTQQVPGAALPPVYPRSQSVRVDAQTWARLEALAAEGAVERRPGERDAAVSGEAVRG